MTAEPIRPLNPDHAVPRPAGTAPLRLSDAARPEAVETAEAVAARGPETPAPAPAAAPAPVTAPPSTAPAPAETIAAPEKPKKRGRRRLLMLSLPLAIALGGGYVWLSGGRYQDTDNAYLHQARVLVASDLSGRVTESAVAENATVHQGDLLFRIDPQPFRIALDQADAAVAAAQVQVRQLKAAYAAALSQRELAQANLDYQQTQSDRQSALAKKGVAAAATLDESRNDLEKTRQALAAAEVGVQSAIAALGGDPDAAVDAHPLVRQAVAARDKAAYALEQTEVRAPADGVLTQASSFQDGQFVAAGTPVFSLIETDDAWVEANFKETQLDGIVPGDAARVTFDAYPGREYEARVEAIGAGTGSEFSLLPAQNATGNWVKVTQRVPVRLRLAGGEGIADLRSGMSAEVSVDTGRETGLDRLRDNAGNAQAAAGTWIADHRP